MIVPARCMTAAQNANRYTDKNGDAAGAASRMARMAGYRGCVCYIAIISKKQYTPQGVHCEVLSQYRMIFAV